MNKKFPFYSQLDQMDCGPTCLRMIAKFYGKHYTLHELRSKSFLTREGVSLSGLNQAAEAIGFKSIGVKIPFDKFEKDAPLPCIVHWDQKHFIVVYKIKNNSVSVADPALGLFTYSKEEFREKWLTANEDDTGMGIALLLEPAQEFYNQDPDEARQKRKSVTYLFSYLKFYKKFIIQLFIGLIGGSLLQLILPFLTQSIVDIGIRTQNINFIYLVLSGQLMLHVSKVSLDFIRGWILLHLSTRINISIISDFLLKLFKLPIPFFEGKMIGDILRRIEDHSRIERFISSSSLSILFSFINFIVFGIVLTVYSIPIFLVFLSLSGLYIGYVLLFMNSRAKLDYRRFHEMANSQNTLIETVQGMSEIKMNNCETRKRWKWEHIQARLFKVSIASTKLQQYQDAGSLFLNEIKNMIITVMAAISVVNGEMTLGMMLAIQYIIGQLNVPLNEFITFMRELQDARISLERVGEIHALENEEEIKDVFQRVTELPESRTLIIKKLSFQYDGPQSPKVLDDIDLIVPEGKITAIVGSSGSGKTTLMKLLLKFYKPNNGSILIGNDNLDFLQSNVWRRQCGCVMQEGYIFSDSIANNISLSDEEIDRTKLEKSVKIANIKNFIESLPLGYNTKVGANGIGLSQGQKQRILIARAVYKNPEFIFFDEATSALDANNEKVIMHNLGEFFKNRTVLIIAHRLSTVKNADQIVVLDNGKVVEIGTHQELTLTRGAYYELVKNQLELGN